MSNLTVSQNFITPQFAKTRGREVSQETRESNNNKKNLFDIWVNPEQYRSTGNSDDHSLNLLA